MLGDLHEAFVERHSSGGIRASIWYCWQATALAVRYLPGMVRRRRRDTARTHVSVANTEGHRMTGLAQDARYALRAVRKDTRFLAIAALIIGIGVGANTAVFSVMSPLMLRPLPFDQPEELVWVTRGTTGGISDVTSPTSNLRDYRELSQSLEELTGYFAFFEYESYNLSDSEQPERIVGVGVAHDFLEVLGVQPMLGRNFVEEEGIWGAPGVAILTHSLWTRRFGADAGIVGRSITLNNQPTEVVGVLPPSFDFASTFSPGSQVDFLKPFPISDETAAWGNTLSMIGRLRPGATVESAQAELDDINRRLQQEQPGRRGLSAGVTDLSTQIGGRFRSAMVLLAAAAGAVMLIACANLSTLLLARSPKRQKEMAVRTAFGASRRRMLRQLLIESLMLAVSGAVIGVLIAFVATKAVANTTAIQIPLLHAVSIDAAALSFTLAVSLVAGLLMGIVPALQISSGGEAAVIKESGTRSSESKRHGRLREVLVVAEVALSCILLVGGGLLLRSFVSVLDVELGFQPRGTVTWRVDTDQSFDSRAAAVAFYRELVANVEAVPGVEDVGLTDVLPLGRNRSWPIEAKGEYYEEGDRPHGFPRVVDHGYLQTMQIPLLSGRYLSADDTEETANVVAINQTAAERLYPGRDPVGQTVLISGAEWQVVGVVGDVRHLSLEEDSGLEFYLPLMQIGAPTLDMVVRSGLPAASIVEGIRVAMRRTDPSIPTADYETLGALIDRSVSPRRFILVLLGAFAATALLLAALGLYGVLAYSVTQRTPEIGIRMALGESARRVQGRVMARTLALAGTGVAIGSVGAFAASRMIGSLLYGVEPTDALSYAGMAGVLLLAAALAGYLPARRAARTEPMVALRS